MRSIAEHFASLQQQQKQLFVPYIMAGDGGIHQLNNQLDFLEECGASAIEVGIPFSDPVADGETIQKAGRRSLAAGTTISSVFKQLKQRRDTRNVPILLMLYVNIIYVYGVESFAKKCSETGVQAIIVPDLPLEEEPLLTRSLNTHGIHLIRLIPITATKERIQQLTTGAKGFIYAIADTGTTGARAEQHKHLHTFLQTVKEVSSIPVLAGFGISTREQVQALRPYCDGVIVGSTIVNHLHHGEKEKVRELMQDM